MADSRSTIPALLGARWGSKGKKQAMIQPFWPPERGGHSAVSVFVESRVANDRQFLVNSNAVCRPRPAFRREFEGKSGFPASSSCGQRRSYLREESRISLILPESRAVENGFSRNGTSDPRSPLRVRTSPVYPDIRSTLLMGRMVVNCLAGC